MRHNHGVLLLTSLAGVTLRAEEPPRDAAGVGYGIFIHDIGKAQAAEKP